MSRLHRLYQRKLTRKNANIIYARRKKDKATVSSVAAFNSDGKLLFGLRNDSEKWTLPGGHAEEGEDPRDAAVRELKEETGLDAGELEYLGDGYGGRDGQIHVFCYKTTVSGEPTVGQDPDDECSVWSWIDAESEIPGIVLGNLHNKKNITLELLGKLDKRADVNIVDEPHEDLIEMTQQNTYPAGEELHETESYHSEDSQRNREGQVNLTELTNSIGGDPASEMSSLHNVGENTQEDPDLKLGEVSAPYSDRLGPLSDGVDDDKKFDIVRGAGLVKLAQTKGWMPAFKNSVTNQIVPSPGMHNINILPSEYNDDWVDGFVDPKGNFFTREETAKKLAPRSKEKYFDSADIPIRLEDSESVARKREVEREWMRASVKMADLIKQKDAVALPDQGVDENKYEDDLSRTDNSISRNPLNEGPIYGK